MQMNKSQLKALIKECIIEVLDEGIMNQGATLTEGTRRRRKKRNVNRNLPPQDLKPAFNPALDTPRQPAAAAANVRQAAAMVAGSGVPQNVMASLLADTAQTTLLEQDQHQSMMGPGEQPVAFDAAGLAMSKIDPLNLPGANNWAAAAGIIDE